MYMTMTCTVHDSSIGTVVELSLCVKTRKMWNPPLFFFFFPCLSLFAMQVFKGSTFIASWPGRHKPLYLIHYLLVIAHYFNHRYINLCRKKKKKERNWQHLPIVFTFLHFITKYIIFSQLFEFLHFYWHFIVHIKSGLSPNMELKTYNGGCTLACEASIDKCTNQEIMRLSETARLKNMDTV